jgi:hypothetical protein
MAGERRHILRPFGARTDNRARAASELTDLHETGQSRIHRVEGGAKVRHEVSALLEVLPCLAPDGVHDEIGNLQRRPAAVDAVCDVALAGILWLRATGWIIVLLVLILFKMK